MMDKHSKENYLPENQAESIEEVDARYRTLFEKTSNPVMVIDTDGNYIDANNAALQFLECTREELLCMNIADTTPPEKNNPETLALHQKIRETGGKIETDYLVKGKRKSLELTIISGQWLGKPIVFGIGTDITEHKKTEASLIESENKFSVAFHSSPDIIAITALKDGRYIDINDNYTRITGYSREELIGQTSLGLNVWAHNEDRNRMVSLLQQEGNVSGEEFEFRMKSGEIRTWRFSAENITLKSEKCLIFTAIDISNTIRNRKLRENENYVLRLIGQTGELNDILDAIARVGEEYEPEIRVAILLYDPSNRVLRLASAPSLPAEYKNFLENGLPVAPDMGTCGTAAYRRERVVVSDIKNSSVFPESDSLVELGLRSSVSQPIISSDGNLMGTIANYTGRTGEPSPASLRVLEWSANLAAVAIEQKQAEQELSLRAQLLDNAMDGICLINKAGNFVYVNNMYSRLHGYSKEELLNMNIIDLGDPAKTSGYEKLITELEEKGYSVFESSHTTKSGTEISLEVHARVISLGEQDLVLSVERDITERKNTEAALRESQEFNNSLLTNSPFPINVINPDTTIRYVNPALEKLTGYPAGELVGTKAPYPYWLEGMEETFKRNILNAMEQGFRGQERQFVRKNGEAFWVKITNTPVKKNGKADFLLASWIDITETKKAEEALRSSEERYRTLMQNAPIGITISTIYGDIIDANTALLKIHGCATLEEYKSMTVAERYLNPDDRERWITALKTEGIVKGFEVRCLRKDGTVFWASIDSISQTTESEVATQIVAVQDITERKQSEAALRESENKYRSLVTNISLGIFRSTPASRGRFLEVNPAMESITGYSRKELLSMDINTLYRNPEDRVRLLEELKKNHEPLTREVVFMKKDGTEIIVMDTKVPVCDAKGTILYFDGILEDITARKAMEEEQQKIAKLESLGVLAGGLAHDFNNLLTGIMGNISLAMMDIETDSETWECLQEADKASERARDLTQQLLTFSRGGAPVKKATSLAGLIKENTGFIIKGSGIKAEYDIPDDLWLVEVDTGQMSQVISNIVINARDAMPGGGNISIQVVNTSITENTSLPLTPGNYVKIAITDTGIGIQSNFFNRIFDPYFTTKQKGSGLGLATSYSIIKNHNGTITVDSRLGTGTTFTIYLPASIKLPEEPKKKTTEPKTAGRSAKILVMDDEQNIRRLLERMLTGFGYDVTTTSHGLEAIAAYSDAKDKGKPFDVVILDITIPGGMGGIETIKNLLDIDPEIKAIVSSGYATDPVMSEYENYGFRAVVTKPYKVAQMKETLSGLLSGN